MGEGIKDIIFNKIADEILNLVIGLSKEELNNLINQNRLQRILLHCLNRFAGSNIFKTEFRDFIYSEDNDLILAIKDEKIDASITKEKLVDNLYPILKRCFVSDNDNGSYRRLLEIVTEQYIQQAKTTIQLYDILKLQQDNFYTIDNTLTQVKDILVENRKREYQLSLKRQQLLKKELYNEMSGILSNIMNRYLYFLCKKSPTLSNVNPDATSGFIDSMCDKIEEIVENITEYIKEDFCQKPIIAMQLDGFEKRTEEVEYYKFMEFWFKDSILKDTDFILKYKDLLDDETYVLILELRNMLNGNIFPSLYKMGQSNIISNKQIKIDVEFFRQTLGEIGNKIVKLKKKLI